MDSAILIAHGTVDSLDELPAFLTKIRRGHPPSSELLAEVKRRYEAIGGRSPLNAINRELASKLEARLGIPVRACNRLSSPSPRVAIDELRAASVTRIASVALAQFSSHVYRDEVESAAREAGIAAVCAGNFGDSELLIQAFADLISRDVRDGDFVVMTAHSLPKSVIDAGDPYEIDVRRASNAIAAKAQLTNFMLSFQSQGMSAGPGGRPMAWLGPDLKQAIESAVQSAARRVLFAPIGFLADHVEILYDLDIEARSWVEERGLGYARIESLNANAAIVDAIEAEIRALLTHDSSNRSGDR